MPWIFPTTADCIVVGDFNSHSPSWGYKDLDTKGEELEDWQIYNTLHLLNRPDDPPTFFPRAWKTTTHPDLAFVTSNISRGTERKVLEQLVTSDHKPVLIEIQVSEPRVESDTLPRWNNKKADWTKFSLLTNRYTTGINCKTIKTDKSAKALTTAILQSANPFPGEPEKTIPLIGRGNYKT